jgi:hypothetical protein
MTTSKNTLEIGCFYPVRGEVMKFTGFTSNTERTEYSFLSWRGMSVTLIAYNTAEAEKKQFAKMADWLQARCVRDGIRLCEGETLDAIARCKITDFATISDFTHKQDSTSEAIAYSMRD